MSKLSYMKFEKVLEKKRIREAFFSFQYFIFHYFFVTLRRKSVFYI